MKASTLKHTLIAVGLILAIPLSAQAAPMLQGKGECDRPMQMQMHKHGGHDGARKAMRNLNLTDAQRDQLFALKHAQAPQMREKAKIARTAQRELRALSQAETFNAQRAKELADASAQARSEMMQLRAQNRHAMMQILTPEQRQKWQQFGQQHGQQRGSGFGNGERGDKGGDGYRMRQS
jgi:Spy/CpxP family protein refolding chaperone